MTTFSSETKSIDSLQEAKSNHQDIKKVKERRALLLDLSGDTNAAFDWASTRLPGTEIRFLDKAELKWASKWKALASIRSLQPYAFCVFANDLRLQSGQRTLMIFAILAGARLVILGDAKNRFKSRSKSVVLLLEAPICALELLFG